MIPIPRGLPRYPPPDRSRVLPFEEITSEKDILDAIQSPLDWLFLRRGSSRTSVNATKFDASEEPDDQEPCGGTAAPAGAISISVMAAPKQDCMVVNGATETNEKTKALPPLPLPNQLLVEGSHLMAPKQSAMEEMTITKKEKTYYNSATAKRTLIGKCHYCVSCPGWNKATDVRYVYSRWEWSVCCFGLCTCISGRQLDQFNADLITDMSAHQNLCQIGRGEGDMVLHKLPGADQSDPGAREFVLNDVPDVATVFQEMTFALSRMNLSGLAAKGLGRLMGAVTWTFPAGYDGAPVKSVDKNREAVYYDSESTKRTVCGYIFNAHCCARPQYKITSERVLYTEWDFWYLCDDPAHLACFPAYGCFFCCRASIEDLCCFGGGVAKRIEKMRKRQAEKAKGEARSCCSRMCAIPVGRSYRFFDMDIVVDVGAHQNCSQLVLNEGDLQLYRLVGGDVDEKNKKFLVKDVPEVFSKFDDLSYVMSQMDLTHFRQSAVGARMMNQLR